MKIPSLLSRVVINRRQPPAPPFELRVVPQATTADAVDRGRIGTLPAPPPANDARGSRHRRQLHQGGCACLTRLADQSGEIRCDRPLRAGERTLPPARPLTGMFSPPGYRPPKVIVSDLLNLGANVDILLDEVELPAAPPSPPPPQQLPKATLTGLGAVTPRSSSVRLQGGRQLRPASGGQPRVILRPRTA
jgi:hypothetical protein